MFTDPLFTPLDVKRVRLVTSYNVMTQNVDGERERVTQYLNTARAAGMEVLVTFEHARGGASVCNKKRNRSLPQCRLPSIRAYKKNVRLFLKAFPFVRMISPWDEVNHFTQPTSRSPKRAARYAKAVRQVCPKCKVLAIDVLDLADKVGARKPTFRSTTRYIKRYFRHFKGRRSICGIHNYGDTNRFRTTGTKALMRALRCKRIWVTETGGFYKFGSFKPNENRQRKATKFAFSIARKFKRIKRIYIYTWFGAPPEARFDSGLTSNSEPRKAYQVVRKQLRK